MGREKETESAPKRGFTWTRLSKRVELPILCAVSASSCAACFCCCAASRSLASASLSARSCSSATAAARASDRRSYSATISCGSGGLRTRDMREAPVNCNSIYRPHCARCERGEASRGVRAADQT